MTLDRDELKKLAPALVLLLLATALGAAMIWYADRSLKAAQAQLATAKTERAQNQERLSKIAEEERDVNEKLQFYLRLKDAHILGEERRLEWADTVARIRKERELLDLRYQVEPQRLMVTLPGKPAPVEFYASKMKVTLSLLHEGDLFTFLNDLRGSGNAYYAVQQCGVVRLGQFSALTTLAPRLRADCTIDLITVMDRGAKS